MAGIGIGFGIFLLSGGLPTVPGGSSPANVELQATRFEIGANGARTVERRSVRPHEPVMLAPTTPAIAPVQLPSGALWTRDEGLYWVGKVVSLGDHGTQVFTEFDSGVDHAEFLSGFDQTPDRKSVV